MQDYTAAWSDVWKKWTEMQADIYSGWMQAWTRGMVMGGESDESSRPEAKDLYRKWLDYLQEMISRFSFPSGGVGPETFMKLFQSADIYTKLYSTWMDMYENYRKLAAEGDMTDLDALRQVLDSWSEEYRELVDKVFAPALPEQLRWVAELYSGEMPLMASGLLAQFWAPWADFSKRMMERAGGMERLSPETAVEVYEEWRKAYEDSYGRILRAPAMGYYREAVEKQTHAMDSLMEFNLVLSEFYASLQSAGFKAAEKLQERLAEMQAEGADEPISFRELYRLWWQTNEDIYVELFRTEEFSKLLGQLVDKGMQFRAAFQAFVEEATKELPFPNRSEMDSLYKMLHGLRREVRRLSREVDELKAGGQGAAGEGKS